MKVPLRLAILYRLADALEEIEFATYRKDGSKIADLTLAENVFRGRVQFGEDDPLPLLSILEVPLQPEGQFAGSSGTDVNSDWELVVQGFIRDDPRDPTDPGHWFMAAVKKRLGELRRERDDAGIMGFKMIDDLTFNSGVVRPPDDTSAVAHFWLTVYVDFVEDVSDPYVDV